MAQLRRTLFIRGHCSIQPFGDPRAGAAIMQHTLDGGHFLAALIRRPARHHRLLVPGQAPGDLGQRLGLALIVHQRLECGPLHAVPSRIDPATGYCAR